jgi:MFS family permease
MLHLHRKHRLSKSSQLSIVQLFIAIALASMETVWALFMYSLGLNESTIGFISGGLIVITLIVFITSIPVLERVNQNKLLATSLLFAIIAYSLIALFPNLILFLALTIGLTIFAVYQFECSMIIFRDNTKTKELNKQEGLLFSILNVGWLVGPLIAGFIIAKFSLNSVFFATAVFLFIALTLFKFLAIAPVKKKRKEIDGHLLKNIRDFFKDKKIHLPYIMATGIEVWWALIYIYVPIFMVKQGVAESYVGLFLSAIVLPLILIDYPIGRLSEKKGFRFFFATGYGSLAVISCIVFFFSGEIFAQLFLLVVASIFVGFIEPLQDTFFFKNVKSSEEEKYYPFQGTAPAIGGFIGKVSIAALLLFLPDSAAFLLIAGFMTIFFLIALRIKK